MIKGEVCGQCEEGEKVGGLWGCTHPLGAF